MWLWCRPVATAPIQPLAWELPYAVGVALKSKKKKKKIKKFFESKRFWRNDGRRAFSIRTHIVAHACNNSNYNFIIVTAIIKLGNLRKN